MKELFQRWKVGRKKGGREGGEGEKEKRAIPEIERFCEINCSLSLSLLCLQDEGCNHEVTLVFFWRVYYDVRSLGELSPSEHWNVTVIMWAFLLKMRCHL